LSLEPLEARCLLSGDVVLDWNRTLLDAIGATGASAQVASRQLAIVYTAMYDAVNAVDRTHTPYFVDATAAPGTSAEAAAAAAAYRASVSLFPTQTDRFDAALARSLDGIPVGLPLIDGIVLGSSVANAILEWRRDDGSDRVVDYTPGTNPGDWQPTPPAFAPPASPQWGGVTPFAIPAGDLFRPEGPPALTSREYTAAFNEVKELGRVDSTIRSAEGTEIALFWADRPLTPGAAVGHWNQIVAGLSEVRGLTLSENARLFALLNLALADAQIAAWDAKYTYNFWRPVTAIRAADSDGNPDTLADPSWTPLIVTPAHPSYTSGHSTVSAAAAAALAGFFGTDTVSFTATSDDLPGVTRSYASFSAASQEAGRSRILAGIHWSFDNFDGRAAGRAVGDYVVANFLRPVPAPARVESLVVNDGSAPRSMVPSLTVTFTGLVARDAGAFGLRRQDGSPVALAVATAEADGRTIALLTFSGDDLIGASPADGNYTLAVRGGLVHDALGRDLDGDGTPGGDRLEALFRLYGDGDRDLDEEDEALLAGTFGRPAGDPEFLGYFDFQGDGDVDGLDRDEFLLRLDTRLGPP
jgi:membrane-associated phospholipid phosphatase